MTDDLLKRATEALRTETEHANMRSGLTRARVLDSASKRYAGPRRLLLRWLITLASLFVVGTALARVSEEWPAMRETLRTLSPFSQPSAAPTKQQHKSPHAQTHNKSPNPDATPTPSQPLVASAVQAAAVTDNLATSAGAAVPAVAPVAVAAHPLTAPRTAPEVAAPARLRLPTTKRAPAAVTRRPSSEPLPSPSQTPPPPTAASAAPPTAASAAPPASAELVLFRRAQALHVANDPQAALTAWDAYLRVAAHGVLAPEAQYNRALCLVRLGRSVEARAALAPFAQGAWGAYRRTEAKALIEALPAAGKP